MRTPAIPSSAARARLRVLVFTTVFPSDARPVHGFFVFERIRHLAASNDIFVMAQASIKFMFNGGGSIIEMTPTDIKISAPGKVTVEGNSASCTLDSAGALVAGKTSQIWGVGGDAVVLAFGGKASVLATGDAIVNAATVKLNS